MENIFLKAYAKINLNLHLLPEQSDRGYYPVRFLNYQLNIFDTIKISKNNDKKINISTFSGKVYNTDQLVIPKNDNLAFRAAQLISNEFNIKHGVNIEIEKNIPIKAGLGGGSCDAAAVINGMNKLFSIGLSPSQKLKIAEKLGMDVCYCVIGGLCLIGNIGNEVIPLPYSLPKIENILLILPKDIQKPSTAWAYSIIDKSEIGKNLIKLQKILSAILIRKKELICKNIWNDFEKPISKQFSIVKDIITELKQNGACAATLAGSGLTVFGIFNDRKTMIKTENEFNKKGYRCIQTSTI
ncbi:MAG: 4-(cytidine 5'-diphospho)-2-C-methyl-D-erythritol kinase [Spirochaetes bacterium]|nr:MAG: 4-(cytidine 5'-diphospho)-2-C-methyl-D-erythritol kinase [Spirochaetota bacterium]